jgi:lysophospholipase L1-like esterase
LKRLACCLLVSLLACSGGDESPDGGDGGQGGSGGATGGAGAGGSAGPGGAGGSAGSGGRAGSAGLAGSGGKAGSAGAAGAAGAAGSAGASGRGGGGGGAGGGASGSAGRGGSAGGAAGSAGRGGSGGSGATAMGLVAAGVRWFGRADISNQSQPRFAWSGTGFVARFSGTALAAQLNNTAPFIFKTVVDGTPRPTFTTTAGTATYNLATGLAAGEHTVELYRQTEGGQGESRLMTLTVTGGSLLAPPEGPGRLIEVIGDSISVGYGTLGTLSDSDCFPTESHWDAFPSFAARALSAEVSTIGASGRGAYRNYGGDMTDTLPKIYERTLTNAASPAWPFQIQPQAVVINLGTNDISNGKGDPGMPFRDAYTGLVTTVRAKYPNAFIICMNGPLLSGSELSTIQAHIRAVVQARNAAGDARISAFEGVQPQTSDKAACQYHPNAAEQELVGNQVAAEIRARLGW